MGSFNIISSFFCPLTATLLLYSWRVGAPYIVFDVDKKPYDHSVTMLHILLLWTRLSLFIYRFIYLSIYLLSIYTIIQA